MNVSHAVERIRGELGATGLSALAVIGCGLLFLFFALKPLEARHAELQRQLALDSRQSAAPDHGLVRASTPAAKLAALYHFLKTDAPPTEWLGRLHTASRNAGVELRSASYRVQTTGTRIERYEITLPVSGNYARIRAFLDHALAEIPVLSLDEVKFKKERPADASVQAELRLTLHLVNP